MFRRQQRTNSSAVVSLFLACLLLAMAPFAAALEIHHELAAADQDGHEHSDTDLCQWVQYHTGHSLTGDAPTPCSLRPEPHEHRLGPNLNATFFSSWLSACRRRAGHCSGSSRECGIIGRLAWFCQLEQCVICVSDWSWEATRLGLCTCTRRNRRRR